MPVGALLAPLVVEGIGAVAPELVGAGTLLGTTAAPGLAASAIRGVVGGAGLGAGEAAITRGNPLLGAAGGAAGGGVGSVAGPALESLGLGSTLSGALGGAAGGLTSSAITGGSPLTGALAGGATGALSGALSPSTSGAGVGGSGSSAAPGPAGGGVGAGGGGGTAPASPGSAAPASTVSGGSPPSSTDLTAAVANNPGSATPSSTPSSPSLGGRVMDFFSNPFGMFSSGSGGGANPNAPSSIFSGTPYAGMNLGDIAATAPDPTAATTAFNAAGGSGGGGIGSTIGSWLAKNPGALLGGALLGGEMLFGNQTPPGLGAVQATAGQEQALAGNLLQPLQTGQVPPGAQSMLDQLTSSMKSKVQSQYASLGLSGSTMEAQDLAKVDQTVAAQKWSIINGLISQGAQELGAAGNLDVTAMNAQVQQDEKLQAAISSFAAALAGGGLRAAA